MASADQVDDGEVKNCGRLCLGVFSAFGKHLAVIVLIVVYSCAGGKLFQFLEEGSEEEACWAGKYDETKIRITALKEIWTAWIEEEENMTALVLRMDSAIKTYRDQVVDIGVDFNNEECSDSSWNWANAVLFSVTIISTIGYGHISPVTWEGQIVCICYAVVGLPIFGVFLSLLGDALAHYFLRGYKVVQDFVCRLFRSECCRSKKQQRNGSIRRDLELASPNAKYPLSPSERHYDSTSPDVISQKIGCDSDVTSITLHQIWPKVDPVPGDEEKSARQSHVSPDAASSFYERYGSRERDVGRTSFADEVAENEEEEEEVITVPLTVSVIVIGGYLGLGGLMFGVFEGWSPMEAAYFSFITLSTIGFGDFVPGTETEALAMLCAAIYIMFGMALLAMCFNLMQDKIVQKVQWIIKRCKRKKE